MLKLLLLPIVVLMSACEEEKKPADKEETEVVGDLEAIPEEQKNRPIEKSDFAFVTPASGVHDARGAYDIEIKPGELEPTAVWSLYYSTEDDPVLGAQAIITNAPTSLSTVSWETSMVEAGEYSLFAVVENNGFRSFYKAPGKVKVPNRGEAAKAPVVQVVAPQGEEAFLVSQENMTISWQASSPTGASLSYRVDYSSDGGSNWKKLAEDLTVTEFVWDISALPPGVKYRVRVTAPNPDGLPGEGLTGVFGISDVLYSFDEHIKPIMENNCDSCHTGDNPDGAFVSDVWIGSGTLNGVGQKIASVAERTQASHSNPMPPSGELEDTDRDILRLWQWLGGEESVQN